MHIWDVLVEIPHSLQLPSLDGMNIILKVRKLRKINIKTFYCINVLQRAAGKKGPQHSRLTYLNLKLTYCYFQGGIGKVRKKISRLRNQLQLTQKYFLNNFLWGDTYVWDVIPALAAWSKYLTVWLKMYSHHFTSSTFIFWIFRVLQVLLQIIGVKEESK